jgi:ABC-type transporter Mla MlaB component
MLLLSLKEQKFLEIDITKVSAIDLSGIQILVAFMRQAMKNNREVRFTGSLSVNFQEQLVLGGISAEPCLTGVQLEAILKAVC